MEQTKYCSGCGNQLSADMQFCPQCGKVVSGSNAEAEYKEREKQFNAAISESRRTWMIFILAIYAIPAIIMGIAALAESSALASSIYSSAEFHDWLLSHDYSYTEADIKSYLTYAAAMILGSGACAAVSIYCLFVKKMWIVAVVACFIAALLCFWSIFGMIIGLLVTWQLFIAKDLFVNDMQTS